MAKKVCKIKRNRRPAFTRRKKNKIFNLGEKSMLHLIDKMTLDSRAGDSLTGPDTTGPVFWESGIEIIKSCGNAPESLPVTIGPIAQAKITALMQEYPRIEWLAYLVGDKDTHHVADIVIPEQEVTAVNVFVGDRGVSVPTIGVIHSHHGMGNGFSGTDHEYINQNHDISLCISHGGIAGQVRTPAACGKYIIVKAEVLHQVEGFDNTAFINDARTCIKPKTYNYTKNTNTVGFSVGGGNVNTRAHQLGFNDFDYNCSEGYEGKVSDINLDENTFPSIGIIELADVFRKDIESDPDSFAVIDLIGMKEIIGEVINPAKNYDRFAAMYTNILDSHTFYIENPAYVFNPAIELIDELDSNFESITIMERNSLIELWKTLKDIIEFVIASAEEAGELVRDEGKTHSTSDKNVSADGAMIDNSEWDAALTEENKNADADIEDKLPSDNLWDTIGNHNSLR